MLLSQTDAESEEDQIAARRTALLTELERCKHAFKMGVSDQAEFDADVRRIRHELDGLPGAAPFEQRRLTIEETARSLKETRALWAVATRTEQRALAQALFRAVHVDLDAQEVTSVELAPCFRDLAPFIGVHPGEEGDLATENDPPAAQCARGPVFGRKRRDSNRAEQRAAARVLSSMAAARRRSPRTKRPRLRERGCAKIRKSVANRSSRCVVRANRGTRSPGWWA